MIALVIAGTAFLLYLSVLRGEFILDDLTLLKSGERIAALPIRELAGAAWRSLTKISFALEIRRFGIQQMAAFHVTNVVLHSANGILLYCIARSLGFDVVLASLGALVFIAHPLASSSVAYISARSTLLSSFFGFCFILVTLTGHPFLALPLLPLAFVAKEDAAMLPITMAALLLTTNEPRWWLYLLLPLAVLALKWKQLPKLMRNNGDIGMAVAGFPASLPQPIYGATAMVEYLARYPFWTIGVWQNVDPEIHAVSWKSWKCPAAAAILMLAGTVVLAIPELRVAAIWFFLSPLTIYPLFRLPDVVAEHRAYFSVTGMAILAMVLMNNAPAVMWVALLTYLSARTVFRAYIHRNPLEYWASASRDGSPDKQRVLTNLGAAWQLRGNYQEAMKCYDRVLELYPHTGPALANVAWIECRQNRPQLAVAYLEKCVKACPDYRLGWQALGEVYQHLKNTVQAEHAFQRAAAAKG